MFVVTFHSGFVGTSGLGRRLDVHLVNICIPGPSMPPCLATFRLCVLVREATAFVLISFQQSVHQRAFSFLIVVLTISAEFGVHRVDGASADHKHAVFSPQFRVELMFNERRSKGVWRQFSPASEEILDNAMEANARLRAKAFQVPLTLH